MSKEKYSQDEKYEQVIRVNELNLETIRPSTDSYSDPSHSGYKIVVIGKPGTGKCLAPGTPVIMYNSLTKNVEKIQVGDLLMGDDSKPRLVKSICCGMDEMYEITQENGDTYTVNAPHILSLKKEGKVVDIEVRNFIKLDKEEQAKYRGYKVKANFLPFEMASIFESISRQVINEFYYDEENDVYETIWPKSKIKDAKNLLFCIHSLGFRGDIKYGDLFFKFRIYSGKKESKIDVKSVGRGFYYGFELDGNKRFLLGDFTVTHNTTLISSILYAKKHIIPVGIVFSGTEDSNGFYKKIFPDTFVFDKYDEGQLEKFRDRQKKAIKYLENPWAVILLDDCTDKPAVFRQPLQLDYYKNGRHWKMLYILSLQYCMDVYPAIRSNVDGIFILRETVRNNRKALYDNYASVIPDYGLFCDLMDNLTNDYTALYINNSVQSNNWQDCVFYYKAIPPPDFKFGCNDYWTFHYDRYDNQRGNRIIS